jgi:hypothetical protein
MNYLHENFTHLQHLHITRQCPVDLNAFEALTNNSNSLITTTNYDLSHSKNPWKEFIQRMASFTTIFFFKMFPTSSTYFPGNAFLYFTTLINDTTGNKTRINLSIIISKMLQSLDIYEIGKIEIMLNIGYLMRCNGLMVHHD